MMRHAYLIIAHNEFELLQLLVSALDAPWADIYVHIDRKVSVMPELHTEYSRLDVFSEVDVRWGDFSQIECEYAILERAASYAHYDYYHILSGVDFPIKPKQYIYDFFQTNAGKEFIDAYPYDVNEVTRKVRYYHIFPKRFRDGNLLIRGLRAFVLRLQFLLHISRNSGIEFKKGAQWCSVTDDFVRYLIGQKEWVWKHFHHTFCSDEIFIQTVCWNSPFRDRAFLSNEWGNGNCRFIDWSDNKVHTLTMEYYDRLVASDCLFARKFSWGQKEIIERISTTCL